MSRCACSPSLPVPTSCSPRTPAILAGCSRVTGSGRGCSRCTLTTSRSGSGELLGRLHAGERLALVSDAGMPGISDPGGGLVAAALAAGLPVTVLPGPSAVETALVSSGLAGGRYAFVGFLPRKRGELEALWQRARAAGPGRWSPSSRPGASARRCARSPPHCPSGPSRSAASSPSASRRWTRGSAAELAAAFSEPPKGEITLVIGAGERRHADTDEQEATAAVARLVAAGTPRAAACEVVAALTGVARNALYRGSL